jgi:hypothetical protein
MNLYQLVYSSIRTPKCTQEEINKILAACQKNNPTKLITGVLLHSDNHFIQYLEGDKDIIKLYDHIKTDPRHKSVVLLNYAPLGERVFPAWHMGYKNVSKQEIDFLTQGNSRDKEVFSSLIKGTKQQDSSAVKLLQKFFQKN